MTKNDKVRAIGYFWAEHEMIPKPGRPDRTRQMWIRLILPDWNPNKALMSYSEEEIDRLYQQTLPKET